jgi:hypothetical protein
LIRIDVLGFIADQKFLETADPGLGLAREHAASTMLGLLFPVMSSQQTSSAIFKAGLDESLLRSLMLQDSSVDCQIQVMRVISQLVLARESSGH